MQIERDFVYIRKDPVPIHSAPALQDAHQQANAALKDEYLEKAKRQGFLPDRESIVIECVSASTPTTNRPELMKTLGTLGPGVELVVWELDDLGPNASEILGTIQNVKRRRSDVYCMSVSLDQLAADKGFMVALKWFAQLEERHQIRSSIPHPIGISPAEKRIGRPLSLDDETRASISAALAEGDTISAIAQRFNTSRQTVMRIRASQTDTA